jgi:hypothetical protein
MEILKDTQIILFNLNNFELNGVLGIINKYNKITGRYIVNIKTKEGQIKELSIKNENILVVKKYYEKLVSMNNPENILLQNSLVKDFIMYINTKLTKMDKGVKLLLDYKISEYKRNTENLYTLERYLKEQLGRNPIYYHGSANIYNYSELTAKLYMPYDKSGSNIGPSCNGSILDAEGILMYLYK